MTHKKRRPAAASGRLQLLPIDKLVPTPDNRRRNITEASVKSLAKSIRESGLIQPIVVRPHSTMEGHFEIRAGERRWRAAKLASLTEIPVIIRDLSDAVALAVTLTENLQREDLHPLEEAEMIQQALDRELDLKAIASRLGRTVPYLIRRASLTQLAEVWKKAVLKTGSGASGLSPAHLQLIARLPKITQEALAEDRNHFLFNGHTPSVAELRRSIDEGLQTLVAMPWKLDDATLDPEAGSCLECSKRSGRQRLLFPEAEESTDGKPSPRDRCLDPSCFGRKLVAHINSCEARLRSKYPDLQLVQLDLAVRPYPEVCTSFANRVQRIYAPRLVKGNTPGALPVMPIDGPRVGKLLFLSPSAQESSESHGRKGRVGDPNGKAVPLTMEERRIRLGKRRQAFIVKRVEAMLRELEPDSLERLFMPEGDGPPVELTFDPLVVTTAFWTSQRFDSLHLGDAWAEYDRLKEESVARRLAAMLAAVIPIWIRRLTVQTQEHVHVQVVEAERVCGVLRIDFPAIAREAVEAIPEPKAWRKLAAIDATESESVDSATTDSEVT